MLIIMLVMTRVVVMMHDYGDGGGDSGDETVMMRVMAAMMTMAIMMAMWLLFLIQVNLSGHLIQETCNEMVIIV